MGEFINGIASSEMMAVIKTNTFCTNFIACDLTISVIYLYTLQLILHPGVHFVFLMTGPFWDTTDWHFCLVVWQNDQATGAVKSVVSYSISPHIFPGSRRKCDIDVGMKITLMWSQVSAYSLEKSPSSSFCGRMGQICIIKLREQSSL